MSTLDLVLAFLRGDEGVAIMIGDREVEFIDDYGIDSGGGVQWYVVSNEFGPTCLVHACGYEDAWSAWLDEQPTIPESELPHAYNVYDSTEMRVWREANPLPAFGSGEWQAYRDAERAEIERVFGLRNNWELVEGFEFQNNGSGTGIVDVGLYATMGEADLSQIVIARRPGA